VNYRYIVAPEIALPDAQFPFFFNYNDTMLMINQGNNDALACINKQSECVPAFEKGVYEYLRNYRTTLSGDY